MWASLIGIITGPLGKIIGYVAIGLSLAGAVSYLWFSRINLIKDNVKLKDALSQYEMTIEQQQKTIEDMKKIQELANQTTKDLNDKLLEQDKKYNDIQMYLNSADAKNHDRPASDILKQTIKELSK